MGEKRGYRKKRKEYAELCGRKKKEENEKWKKRMKKVIRESKMWEIINKERKKKKGINEEIELEEWKEYFMKVMGRVEERVRMGEEKRMEKNGRGKVRFGGDKESNKGDKDREGIGSG